MFVDSHCHLDFPDFQEDLTKVLQRAAENLVSCFLTICTKDTAFQSISRMAEQFPNVFATVGVHPHEAEHAQLHTLKDRLVQGAKEKKVVGIGETGLDFYYENSARTLQNESFSVHLAVAQEMSLPVIVHTRMAEEETIGFLRAFPRCQGVIHCFTGSKWLAEQALDLGFFISLSGIITFKNAAQLQEIVRYVPLERLLIETDSPFLAPVPYRGKRNEPAFIVETAKKIATLKGLLLEQVAHQTARNFFSLFSKIPPDSFFKESL